MSVRNALLGLLAQRPRHGYELHAAFEAVVGGQQNWDVKPAQIYTTLARLESSGLVRREAVEQDGGPEKRIYAITGDGLAELSQWFERAVELEHGRDEFFVKLMLSLATGQIDPYRVIQRQRSLLYQELHGTTLRRSEANPRQELAQIFLFDKAIMHLEADLRWLDMIEARLDEIKRQPMARPELRPRGRRQKAEL
jgi:DNA-binding PadR family transcriptional regulator